MPKITTNQKVHHCKVFLDSLQFFDCSRFVVLQHHREELKPVPKVGEFIEVLLAEVRVKRNALDLIEDFVVVLILLARISPIIVFGGLSYIFRIGSGATVERYGMSKCCSAICFMQVGSFRWTWTC